MEISVTNAHYPLQGPVADHQNAGTQIPDFVDSLRVSERVTDTYRYYHTMRSFFSQSFLDLSGELSPKCKSKQTERVREK